MMGADSENELALPGFQKVRPIDIDDGEQTCVQLIFKLLSRKSKKKLEELLHQWSEWHAQECLLSEGSDEDLESGEETYFPALNVSSDKSCTISVYMDNQVKKKQRTDEVHFSKDSVPIYNREFDLPLTSDKELTNKDSVLDLLNAPRCFNCDSYDHSLKKCPNSFNKEVVNNARKLHQLKSKRPSGPHVLTRYYQDTPGGKFDGLKPGCLDNATRKLLCLGEYDPPPWLNRMREMGYPPGYLDLEDEEQPSEIIIYADGDTKEENEERVITSSTGSKWKMTVDFPGISAPIPVNADKNRWAAVNFKPTGFKSNSNNIPLNHKIESCPGINFRGPLDNNQEVTPLMSDYANSYQHYVPSFPLLSNYAKSYLDLINQNSSFAYQNSRSSFHS